MTRLVFIEGVSGVGKSTMVRRLARELAAAGYSVENYVEFDYRNPIDFYCVAYLSAEEHARLCREYSAAAATIRQYTVDAGAAKLVRYYNEDTPLFDEPLLSELARREFCYKPRNPVTLEEYSRVYRYIWRDFAERLDGAWDFMLFDGSLLHHPINDMMRNYQAEQAQMTGHVLGLLQALGDVPRSIFYMQTDDLAGQLAAARRERGQLPPTEEQRAFWQQRHENDCAALNCMAEEYHVFDVSRRGWDAAARRMLEMLLAQI